MRNSLGIKANNNTALETRPKTWSFDLRRDARSAEAKIPAFNAIMLSDFLRIGKN